MWHGDDLLSHGFAFSLLPSDDDNEKGGKPVHVVYLSDLSKMVPETLEYIQQHLPPTDVLIIDSLLWHKDHPVHYSLDQAVKLATDHIRPTTGTYLIGMSCDNFLPHEEMNHHLTQQYGGTIQFAHDGLPIFLPPSPLKKPVENSRPKQ